MDKQLLGKTLCRELLHNQCLPALAYQYIEWNNSENYETKSFSWLINNVFLISSIEGRAFEVIFKETVMEVEAYSDLYKIFKDKGELQRFNHFSKLIPFSLNKTANL